MKNPMEHARRIGGGLFAMVALLVGIGLTGSGCESTQEAIDNFDSRVACDHYCDKNFDCQNKSPTGDETDTCVSKCRDSIEDKCGNEHQAAANDHIEDCVNKACADFWACMVFDAAPECYGFVSQ